MKIIFSRKGFDSSSGGCPSPILPDGRIISLPIPDKNSPIKYRDISWEEFSLGDIVSSLTRNRIKTDHNAHLDPDLNFSSIQRLTGWRPIFGQTDAAQGHLRNNRITVGDIFLFYGLFKDVIFEDGVWLWKRNSTCKHIIWGWMQIGQVLSLEESRASLPAWLKYHPHLYGDRGANNTLYIADKSGVFPSYSEKLQLTSRDSLTHVLWDLPAWMYPREQKTPLTYHSDQSRWKKKESSVELKVVSKGQEFILNCRDYPESEDWLSYIIQQDTK
jgi:Nucleotide modification associated domain 3